MSVKNIFLLLLGLLTVACNRDGVITDPDATPPEITIDSEDGVYVVMLGNSLTVFASVDNAVNPSFRWVHDEGKVVSTYESLTFEASEIGEYYFTFYCSASNGTSSVDIRIDVVETLLPSVSLPEELSLSVGEQIRIEPALANAEGANFSWSLDGEIISTDEVLLFSSLAIGVHTLTLSVTNSEGTSEASTVVRVTERPPLSVNFDKKEFTVCLGRGIYLQPIVEGALSTDEYVWTVDGNVQADASSSYFLYKPLAIGQSKVCLTVKTVSGLSRSSEVTVNCVDQSEMAFFRPVGQSSSADNVKVFEFMPAPGQFVGRIQAGTMTDACVMAESAVNSGEFVSLGAFGGYIVVGFDHSISRSETIDYEFGIAGNSFDTSNEPGIVYVMQDENGNGLPDDTWYELRGSQWESLDTWHDYAVTYFRPSSSNMPVAWRDNRNNTGTVSPAPYWPSWQTADSYTLRGSRLKETVRQHGMMWRSDPYPWGYADNLGSDIVSGGANNAGGRNFNGFSISNAVYPDGTPADLLFIDFVKVQTAVNFNSGILGEVSTEVIGFVDYTM